MTELGSITDGRSGPARQKRDSEKKRDFGEKRDSDFDEPGPARHGTVTEVGVQADRARPGKNGIRIPGLKNRDPQISAN